MLLQSISVFGRVHWPHVARRMTGIQYVTGSHRHMDQYVAESTYFFQELAQSPLPVIMMTQVGMAG